MSYRNRSVHSREKTKQLLIIVDGASEERYFESEYFDAFRHIRVIPVKSGKCGVCNSTLRKSRVLMREYRIDVGRGDRVAIVTDVDNHADSEIMKMKSDCGHDMELYVSNPCFEVWLILHFKRISRWYEPDELLAELTKCTGKKYEKSVGIPVNPSLVSNAIGNSEDLITDSETMVEECLDRRISRTTIQFLLSSMKRYK